MQHKNGYGKGELKLTKSFTKTGTISVLLKKEVLSEKSAI